MRKKQHKQIQKLFLNLISFILSRSDMHRCMFVFIYNQTKCMCTKTSFGFLIDRIDCGCGLTYSIKFTPTWIQNFKRKCSKKKEEDEKKKQLKYTQTDCILCALNYKSFNDIIFQPENEEKQQQKIISINFKSKCNLFSVIAHHLVLFNPSMYEFYKVQCMKNGKKLKRSKRPFKSSWIVVGLTLIMFISAFSAIAIAK